MVSVNDQRQQHHKIKYLILYVRKVTLHLADSPQPLTEVQRLIGWLTASLAELGQNID